MRQLQTHLSGVAWMAAERVWMLLSGVVVGFAVARSLGPEDLGRFSVALAISAVLSGLAAAGIDSVLIRRLSIESTDATDDEILAAGAGLRVLGSSACVVLVGIVSICLFPRSPDIALMAILIASAGIFRAPEVLSLWLQARNQYRQAAVGRTAARICGDIVRIVLIFQQASALWFACAMTLEGVASAAIFCVVWSRKLAKPHKFDKRLASELFRTGRPVMMSGLASALYARLDQLVLFHLLGPASNGLYAAAARVSEAFNVVFLSIGTVAAAHFGRLVGAPAERVSREMLIYYRGMTLMGLALATALSLLAGPIIATAYGREFEDAASILRIHAWTLALVCMSVAMEPWFYHHDKVRYFVPKTILSLLCALPLTFFGTKFFGPQGTAGAIVITYLVSVVFSNALFPGLRGAFEFQIAGFRISRS